MKLHVFWIFRSFYNLFIFIFSILIFFLYFWDIFCLNNIFEFIQKQHFHMPFLKVFRFNNNIVKIFMIWNYMDKVGSIIIPVTGTCLLIFNSCFIFIWKNENIWHIISYLNTITAITLYFISKKWCRNYFRGRKKMKSFKSWEWILTAIDFKHNLVFTFIN